MICSSSHTYTQVWICLVFSLTGFRFHIKNIDIISFMCIEFYPYTLCFQKSFNILFLYLYMFWRKRFFFSKYKFWKLWFSILSLTSKSQKWFKMFVICVKYWSHIFALQSILKNWFFVELIWFYGILIIKTSFHVLYPCLFCAGGRPGRSTDVYKMCTLPAS